MDHIKIDNFLKSARHMKGPVVILLKNDGCPSCDHVFRILEEISEDYEGKATFLSCALEANEMPIFGPPGIPAVVGFSQGSKFFEAMGEAPEEIIRSQIDHFLHEVHLAQFGGPVEI